MLKAHGISGRKVWVADSFQGLPQPKPEQFPQDAGDVHHTYENLKISQEFVRRNFERYGLLDEQVEFLPGWFQDTLPGAPVERIAVARLDGDMYESTIVALEALYDKVSPGGYIIIDDYNCVPGCQAAVDDFRKARGIREELRTVDWACSFWRKAR